LISKRKKRMDGRKIVHLLNFLDVTFKSIRTMTSRVIIKSSAALLSSLSVYGLGSSYYNRSKPDIENGLWGGPSHYPSKPVTPSQAASVAKFASTSRTVGSTWSEGGFTLGSSIGEYIGSTIIVNLILGVITAGMRSPNKPLPYNRFHPIPSADYLTFLEVLGKQSDEETIITVSNHGSTIDDPTLFGCILSSEVEGSSFGHHTWGVNRLRWSLCSQEICFKTPLLATFFTGGRVLPIKRGSSIDQPLLHDFAMITAKGGEWVHVFPEGKIYQSGKVGRDYYNERSDEDR
jgi:hypothetical protein